MKLWSFLPSPCLRHYHAASNSPRRQWKVKVDSYCSEAPSVLLDTQSKLWESCLKGECASGPSPHIVVSTHWSSASSSDALWYSGRWTAYRVVMPILQLDLKLVSSPPVSPREDAVYRLRHLVEVRDRGNITE